MAEGGANFSHTCSVCFEEYKVPKVLSCGHTFCLECIETITKGRGDLNCPKCRRKVLLPKSGGVKDLPTNFELMSLIEQTQDSSNGVVEESKQGRLCPQHKSLVELYCIVCKEAVCAKCMLARHKFGKHNIVSIDDIANVQRLNIQLLKDDFIDLEGVLQRIKDTIDNAETCLAVERTNLENAVKQYRSQEHSRVDRTAARLLSEIRKKAAVSEKRCKFMRTIHSRYEKKCENVLGKADKLEKELDKSRFLKDGDIEVVEAKVKRLLLSIPTYYNACSSTPTEIDLKFVKKSNEKFGEIVPIRELSADEKMWYKYVTEQRVVYVNDSEDENIQDD